MPELDYSLVSSSTLCRVADMISGSIYIARSLQCLYTHKFNSCHVKRKKNLYKMYVMENNFVLSHVMGLFYVQKNDHWPNLIPIIGY